MLLIHMNNAIYTHTISQTLIHTAILTKKSLWLENR